MEGVESNGAQGGTDPRTSKRDRRIFWAGVFILVSNCFQYTAYIGVSTNLVNYFKDRLHQGSKAAANGVTNWQGTSSITPLVAFLGRYWTIALFLLISVLAYVVLAVSAAAALHAASLYAGLYLLSLGGALQPVLSSFGADC